MAALFEKLDQSSRLNDSGGFPYLRSHPLTSERIGEARARLGTAEGARTGASEPSRHGAAPAGSAPAAAGPPAAAPLAASTGALSSALEHTAAQARSRVLMDADRTRHV